MVGRIHHSVSKIGHSLDKSILLKAVSILARLLACMLGHQPLEIDVSVIDRLLKKTDVHCFAKWLGRKHINGFFLLVYEIVVLRVSYSTYGHIQSRKDIHFYLWNVNRSVIIR